MNICSTLSFITSLFLCFTELLEISGSILIKMITVILLNEALLNSQLGNKAQPNSNYTKVVCSASPGESEAILASPG